MTISYNFPQGTATYLHGRTVGDSETLTTNTVENEPGRDRTFTSQEIEEWQRNMEPKISPEANQIYGDILRENFKKGTTQTDHIKGIVCIKPPNSISQCVKYFSSLKIMVSYTIGEFVGSFHGNQRQCHRR